MSEIFLDTETTGLNFKDGHKVVEIACIETKDLIPTGRVFHKLINPQRNMPNEAYKVHGFSDEFLKNKETFDKIADVAQLVEHLICNQGVGGSSPSVGTINILLLKFWYQSYAII